MPLVATSISIPNSVSAGSSITATVSPTGGDYYLTSDYDFFWYRSTGSTNMNLAQMFATTDGPTLMGVLVEPGYSYFVRPISAFEFILDPYWPFPYSNWCQVTSTGVGPIFDTPVCGGFGFTVNIQNYSNLYTWDIRVNAGFVTVGSPQGTTLPITVSGLAANGSATVTATSTRPGYATGSGSVTGYTCSAVPPPSGPSSPPFEIADPPLPITDSNSLATLGNLPGPVDGKIFVLPENEVDQGYKTYLCKFNLEQCDKTTAVGIFFNMDSSKTTTNGTIFVEMVKYQTAYAQYQQNLGKAWRWSYGIIAYLQPDGAELSSSPQLILGFADATLAMDFSDYNTPSVLVQNPEYDSENPDAYAPYSKKYDKLVHMKVVHYEEDRSLGNTSPQYPEVLRVFINNVEIKNWYTLKYDSVKTDVLVKEIISPSVESSSTIPIVGKPRLPACSNPGTLFGVYCSQWSQYSWATQLYANKKYNFVYNDLSDAQGSPLISEIYATQTALIDPYENYFHGSKQFLTDIAMNKNSLEKSYCMQTNPAAVGLNFYDVQYTTPAATNVSVYPISYLLSYVPSETAADQKYAQNIVVNEDALNYSVPINTGFRAKLFVENNSPYLVFLKKEPDSKNTVTVNLNLWTHSIIAPSDQQILESVIDPSNSNEVVQVDSEWIQSGRAANKIVSAIAAGIEGFSKTIELQVFGNPLLQVGDVINLSYSLNGIKNTRYIIKRVSHSYDTGLTTSLTLAKMNI